MRTLKSCRVLGEMATVDSEPLILNYDGDNFNGVLLKPKHYDSTISPEDFHKRLSASLVAWQSAGKRGAWVKIMLAQAELVQVAAKLGFEFHHAQTDYVMMTRWLPTDEPSTLPGYATHYIGVAGFVVNDKNEVLLVQEKWLRNLKMHHWKLPGGHADPGEDLSQTAIRETFEETGIRTEFISVLCFRHMHGYRFRTDDLYFACLLRPISSEITVSESEISAAKWMDVDEYLADPQTLPTNRMIAQAYKDGLARKLFINPLSFPHFLKDRPNMVMYSPQPTNGRSCDRLVTPGDENKTQPKANI